MRIKSTVLDQRFSLLVRSLHDWTCEKCGTKYGPRHRGLHTSHYFGRAAKSTRFSLLNCDCLCMGCHRYMEANPHAYYVWKLGKLGPEKYQELVDEHNQHVKFNKEFVADTRERIERQLLELDSPDVV